VLYDVLLPEITLERGRGSLHIEQFQGKLVWFIAFDPRVQFELGINLKSVFTMLRTFMLD
jgi:hypothetical protein